MEVTRGLEVVSTVSRLSQRVMFREVHPRRSRFSDTGPNSALPVSRTICCQVCSDTSGSHVIDPSGWR